MYIVSKTGFIEIKYGANAFKKYCLKCRYLTFRSNLRRQECKRYDAK